MNPELLDEATRAITAKLTDEGKLIEAGWVALRAMAVPKDARQIQIDEMRTAFFAGAHHLFASITSILDPGEEPTERDLRRMEAIHNEINLFVDAFKQKHGIK